LEKAASFFFVLFVIQSSAVIKSYIQRLLTLDETSFLLHLSKDNSDKIRGSSTLEETKLNAKDTLSVIHILKSLDSLVESDSFQCIHDFCGFSLTNVSQLKSFVQKLLTGAFLSEIQKITHDLEVFLISLYRIAPQNDEAPSNASSTTNKSIRRYEFYRNDSQEKRKIKTLIPKEADEQPKNRKGQRARRAEWEQLYGEKAKHLTKETIKIQKNPENNKDQLSNLGRDRFKKVYAGNSLSKSSQSESTLQESLHPSWVAQKRLKDIQSQAISSKNVNKRIKFED
jgi:hypothetical protein